MIFFLLLLQTYIIGTQATFRAKIKNVYPCKPQLYYNKGGCKGVSATRTCFRDEFDARLNGDIYLFIYLFFYLFIK